MANIPCELGKKVLPIMFCKTSECNKMLKSNVPKCWCHFHAFPAPTPRWGKSDTFHDLGFSFGVLASHNCNAKCFCDRYKIEGGSPANYSDTGNSHGIKDGKTSGLLFPVIMLVGSNCFSNDL